MLINRKRVFSFLNSSLFPTTGQQGIVYIDLSTSSLYLWDVSLAAYVLPASGGSINDPAIQFNTYADLPDPTTIPLNTVYLVKRATGVWGVNRKQNGLYQVQNDGGSNFYKYLGLVPENLVKTNSIFTNDNRLLKTQGTSSNLVEQTAIEIDDNNNLDLKAGGIKDNYITTAIYFGESGEIALNTTKKSFVGGINENRANILLKADDNAVVHLTGNESIDGIKTFNDESKFLTGVSVGDYIGLGANLLARFNSPSNENESLDQEFASKNASALLGTMWQSFTAGNTGYLSAVSVHNSSGGTVTGITVKVFSGEGIGGSEIAEETGISCANNVFTKVNLSDLPYITSGQKYTIQVISTGDQFYWSINTGGGYANGTFITAGQDALFRSYVAEGFNFVFDKTNNRIGIGLTNPTYTLDVLGTFNVSGNSIIGGNLNVDEKVVITGLSTEMTVQIQTGADVSATSDGYLVMGELSGVNLCLDNNEIEARDNGSANTTLYIQNDAGIVRIRPAYTNTTANSPNMYVDSVGVLYRSTCGEIWKNIIGDGSFASEITSGLFDVDIKKFSPKNDDTIQYSIIANEQTYNVLPNAVIKSYAVVHIPTGTVFRPIDDPANYNLKEWEGKNALFGYTKDRKDEMFFLEELEYPFSEYEIREIYDSLNWNFITTALIVETKKLKEQINDLTTRLEALEN